MVIYIKLCVLKSLLQNSWISLPLINKIYNDILWNAEIESWFLRNTHMFISVNAKLTGKQISCQEVKFGNGIVKIGKPD